MNKSQDRLFAHGAPARGKNRPSYASSATPVGDPAYNSRSFSPWWLTGYGIITRLARYLRRFRAPAFTRIIGDEARESGYRLPILSGEFHGFVVEPDGREHWIVEGGPDDWSDPSHHRQRQFGAHPDVPFEGLAQ